MLSEGQNLQDAGIMLNYDLHWNPTRMVQRAGCIDRLRTPYDLLWVYNMFPDEGLESLLYLVESLTSKIETINTAGFLDASILGEEVHPRSFNTLRRIRAEDHAVIEEQESFAELASSEALLRQLQQQLTDEAARRGLEELPDGIHSGLQRERQRGVFFYLTAPARRGEGRQHFWRYYDFETRQVSDNRYLIANLIRCRPDAPRYVPAEGVDIFEVQERVIEEIVRSAQEQQAIEAAPKQIDPIQQTIITALRGHLGSAGVDRRQVLELVRFLNQPLPNVHVRALRAGYDAYQAERSVDSLVAAVQEIQASVGRPATREREGGGLIDRDSLHLVCFDYVWS